MRDLIRCQNGMARKTLGHDVRLIPTQHVKPLLKGHKNDYRDAEVIAETVQRPTMEIVSIKTPQQSHLLSLHRVRSRLVGQRTSSVLNFTTLDIQPGDWLKIGSQVASTGFATAGPSDWVRISAVSVAISLSPTSHPRRS